LFAHQVVVDPLNAGRRVRRDQDCTSHFFGFGRAPEIHDTVHDGDIKLMNTSPWLALQLAHEHIAYSCAWSLALELGSGTCDGLNDIGPANDTNKVSALGDDGTRLI
jgi:hypothetical protein